MTVVVEGRINKNQRWIVGSTAWLPLAVLVVVWGIIMVVWLKESYLGWETREWTKQPTIFIMGFVDAPHEPSICWVSLVVPPPTSTGPHPSWEGHLMCLSSVRVSSGGNDDDGGGMSKYQSSVAEVQFWTKVWTWTSWTELKVQFKVQNFCWTEPKVQFKVQPVIKRFKPEPNLSRLPLNFCKIYLSFRPKNFQDMIPSVVFNLK